MKPIFETVHAEKIIQTSIEHQRNQLAESITSLGNGYMGCRGNYEEYYTGDTLKGTYIAGVWVPDKTRVGWWKNGYPRYYGKVINAPDFLSFDLFLDGERLDLAKANILSFYREVNLKNGIMSRKMDIQTLKGSFSITSSRFFSIVRQPIAVLNYTFTSIDYTGTVEIRTGLNGDVSNRDANYGEKFWEILDTKVEEALMLTTRTKENAFDIPRFTVCMKADVRCSEASPRVSHSASPLESSCSFRFEAAPGQKLALDKLVCVVTSRDYAENELPAKAGELLEAAKSAGPEALALEQNEAWAKRWEMCDVVIEGDDAAQQGIRFNLFHLWNTYDGRDPRLNVGPKGFTGEKYGGAAYYDTEGYCFPMYLATADPEVAKSLLLFRYNTLEKAKENAAKIGMKGALYPMVTFNGEECHNEWEITFEELHRNAAIVYAIYCYTKYTGDESYIRDYGIHVMLEVSRFWASRCNYSAAKDAYVLLGVSAPNEYENNINNNWLTNFMAKWCIDYTLENVEKFHIELEKEELEKFREISAKMYLGQTLENGVIVQQDGFMDKELLPVSAIPEEELPLCKHWSWDRILRSCYIKQADVVLGFYYFPDRFTAEQKKVNFQFYEPMTVHESSLSPSMHSVVASHCGLPQDAYRLYKRAARLDLDNFNDDTDDGLHITSMAGSWLAIVHGFAGMNYHGELLSFTPNCPQHWKQVDFRILYRGRLLNISFNHQQFTCRVLKGEPLELMVSGKIYKIDGELTVDLQ